MKRRVNNNGAAHLLAPSLEQKLDSALASISDPLRGWPIESADYYHLHEVEMVVDAAQVQGLCGEHSRQAEATADSVFTRDQVVAGWDLVKRYHLAEELLDQAETAADEFLGQGGR